MLRFFESPSSLHNVMEYSMNPITLRSSHSDTKGESEHLLWPGRHWVQSFLTVLKLFPELWETGITGPFENGGNWGSGKWLGQGYSTITGRAGTSKPETFPWCNAICLLLMDDYDSLKNSSHILVYDIVDSGVLSALCLSNNSEECLRTGQGLGDSSCKLQFVT